MSEHFNYHGKCGDCYAPWPCPAASTHNWDDLIEVYQETCRVAWGYADDIVLPPLNQGHEKALRAVLDHVGASYK